MLSEDTATNYGISLAELFPNYSNQFLVPFENVVDPDLSRGIQLEFDIVDRTGQKKKCPILSLAKPENAREIVEIYKDLYDGTYPYKEMEDEQEVRKMIENPECDWIVFKDIYDNTVGCFTFLLDFEDKKGYIRGLMVRKNFQGDVDVLKAVIGSYIGMYTKYKDKIFRWYCENRTAHAKSQYALSLGGIKPIAFYPNKDIFLNKIESDIMHICYDERALRDYRSKETPNILPEVENCFAYSNKRYGLGTYTSIRPKITLDTQKIRGLKKKLTKKNRKDKFEYETITLSFTDSDSYFTFLYTPTIRNIEKTEYKIDTLEELFVFIEEFKRCGKELGIRYCEVFVSAYCPKHQQLFYNAGLSPRGYIPSWKYNQNRSVFEDYILFNSFKGQICEDIQLIEEGQELLNTLNLYEIEPKKRVTQRLKKTIIHSQKMVKSCLMGGLCAYLSLLLLSALIAGLCGTSEFNLITFTISSLGSVYITPLPFVFDMACIVGGVTTILFNILFSRHLSPRDTYQIHIRYWLNKIGLFIGILGSLGYVLVGIFSLDRSGPEGMIHGWFAIMAFGGFTTSIFIFSVYIVFYQNKIPKVYGIVGLVGPILTSILHSIIVIPLIEWILLFTIILSLVPQFFWIFIKELNIN